MSDVLGPGLMGFLLCVLSQALWLLLLLFFGQRTDHLLRCPGELLKDSEEDAAGPQDRNTAAGTKRHLEWDPSPSDGAL